MSKEDLTPIVDFLTRHPPFQQMEAADREFLARHATLAFFAEGEVILSEEQGEAKQFFILKQGRVRRETRAGEVLPEGAWELMTGECFPIGALLSRRPVHTVQRAVEDTFAYVIPRERFDEIYQRSAVFHDFCSSRLANLLDHALRTAQGNKANQASSDSSLSTPLSSLIRRAPIHSAPDTPMEQVLQFMQDERVGSVVATDGEGRPLGIFTLHDLLSRVALPDLSLSAKLSDVMTHRPFALSHTALARDAAMVMAEKGFAHICVTDDDGKLIGVLSERDLFSLQRVGLVNLARAIPKAANIQDLADLGRDVHQLIDQMLAQGASVAQLTQITALLNDHITRRVIDLCLAEVGHPGFPFTWLAFGSEGRGEQTLRTGQDNGILFVPPHGLTADRMRETLLPLARRINDGLEATGFPLGEGKVIAAKAECCLSLTEWRERFSHWIDQGTPEELLGASTFFDLRPIWGEEEPARELMRWVVEDARQDARFLQQMAANALRNKPPLGIMRDFVTDGGDGDHPDCLDLKVTGTIPFVDGARVLAIANGVTRTNTLERFRGLIERGAVATEEVDAWCDAYGFIQLLRMRLHQAQEQKGEPLANFQNPEDLSELDRRILKESFRQERKLQSKLSQEYRA